MLQQDFASELHVRAQHSLRETFIVLLLSTQSTLNQMPFVALSVKRGEIRLLAEGCYIHLLMSSQNPTSLNQVSKLERQRDRASFPGE